MEISAILFDLDGVRKFTFQEKAALAEENNRRYRQLLMGLTQADVSPPVRQTLRELRARGVPAGGGLLQ